VHDLDQAPGRAFPPVVIALYGSPLSQDLKDDLAGALLKAYAGTPKGQLPDLEPAFDRFRAATDPTTATQITVVQTKIESTIEREVTRSFRRPLRYCAIFALLVVPLLLLRLMLVRNTRSRT